MESPESPNLKSFIYILSCRKWLIVFPFIIISSAIIAIGAYLPKVYQASSTILFEPLGVSRDFVKPMLETPMQNRLRNLSKEITSRSRIKQIIREFQLDRKITSPIELERLITGMQKMIKVEVSGNESFKISFQGRNPLLITQITNRIAALFIEEYQRGSRHQAETATLFLSRELEKVEQQLKAQEAKLLAFRQEHYGELPEQEGLNLRMLDRLQLQSQSNEQALKNAREQEQFLTRQLSNPSLTRADGNSSPSAGYRWLEQLKSELARLKAKYSDQWPEVKKIKREIVKQEQQLASSPPASQHEIPAVMTNPASQELMDRLTNVRKTIAGLKKDKKRLLEDIKEYNQRMENLPQIEQELAGLTENYNRLKSNYESLRSKKLDAKLSEDFQFARKNGYFRILDPAELPLTPIKPEMGRILLLALFAGLGGGVGAVFLREYMDDSLKNSDDTEQYLNLPVIGLIPAIKTPQDVRQAKIRNIQYVLLLCLYLVFIGLLIKYRKPIKTFFLSHNSLQNISASS